MPVILNHEKQNFKKGEGLADIITGVTDFVKSNKDLISTGAKAVSSVANASSKIADTVKKANELKEIQLIREQHNKNLENKQKKELPQSIKDKLGTGFKKI